MIYSICDFIVEYNPRFPRLTQRSEKYICADQNAVPEISFEVTDEDIAQHIKKFPMPSDQAEYVVAGIKFYRAIILKGAFFLHSSALAVDGKGYVFTGPCGAGKSTHATLWRKCFKDKVISINDDKPAVRFFDGVPYICGTPFSGKHDINTNTKVPLCGISILSQSPENTIKKVDSAKAMTVLLDQTLRPETAKEMSALFEMFDSLLKKVPVYSFGCNISAEAVKMSYTTMRDANI
ncbi:MAG: hypothetical protein II225_03140 [Ruminococcus sp.]|nr:hypothetical protein [Ruminococcus sp.]